MTNESESVFILLCFPGSRLLNRRFFSRCCSLAMAYFRNQDSPVAYPELFFALTGNQVLILYLTLKIHFIVEIYSERSIFPLSCPLNYLGTYPILHMKSSIDFREYMTSKIWGDFFPPIHPSSPSE